MKQKGFTLLEILLVIAAIGILAAIVIVAINPNRQLAQVRDVQRRSDVNSIYKAISQYLIDAGSYPSSVSDTYQEICNTGDNGVGEGSVNSGCVDLRELVPTYLAGIPLSPDRTSAESGYFAWINPINDRIAIASPYSELGQEISINNTEETGDMVLHLDVQKQDSYPGTGNVWNSIFPASVPGTLFGAPTFTENTDPFFNFNGTDQYLTIPEENIISERETFTWEFFINPSNISGTSVFILNYTRWGTNDFNLGFTNDQVLVLVNNTIYNISNTNTNGNWQHIAWSFDLVNNQYSFYKNGELEQTVNGVGQEIPLGTYQDIRIFVDDDGGGNLNQHFGGLVRNIKFYSSTLDQNQIRQNYNRLLSRYSP